MPPKKISWTVFEYEHKDRTNDWFWALGIIAVSAAVAAIIYKNYFFAVLILLGLTLLAGLSLRKPKEIDIELNERGVVVDELLYPYKTLKSFFADEDKLLLHSSRLFMPIITLHFDKKTSAKEIGEYLKKYLPEEEMEEPFTNRLMEVLGF
jgi:hypothetical protein